ncbi:hypothetical protein C8R43DRAFT_954920 [Mycena crocata]|nr:hypothetical protein C8R43DRAFT_954920 [Mycena crocata]
MTFRNTTCLLVTAACVASPSSPPSIKFDFSLPPPLLFAHASSSPQLHAATTTLVGCCSKISSSSASSARIFLRKFPRVASMAVARRVASTITHMYTKFYSIFGGPANWDFMSINTTRPPRNFDSIFRRTTRSTPRRILNSIFGTEDGFKYGDLGNSGDGHLPYYPPVGGRRHSDAAISAMFNFGVPTPRATAFSAIPFKCA